MDSLLEGPRRTLLWSSFLWLMACSAGTPGLKIDRSQVDRGMRCSTPDPGPPEEYVYVVDRAEDRLVVVNPRTCKVVERVVVPADPLFANASPSGRWVYVVSGGSRRFTVIDTDTNEVVAHRALTFVPRRTAFDGTRRKLWILGAEQGAVYDVQAETLRPLAVAPEPLAMTGSAPPRAIGYDGSQVVVWDVDGDEVGRLSGEVTALAYSVPLDRVFGCHGDRLFAIGTDAEPIGLPGRCEGLRFAADRARGAVLHERGVSWYEGGALRFLWPGRAVAADWVSDELLVVEPGSDALRVMDERGDMASIPLSPSRAGAVPPRVSLDRRHVYVVTDGGLAIVDVLGRRVRGHVPVGGDPVSVIVAGPVGGTCC